MVSLFDVIKRLEKIAPPSLAYKDDIIGLQIGPSLLSEQKEVEVEKIMVTLDPTYEAMVEAARKKVNLVITHHSLFPRPTLRVSDVYLGILRVALRYKIGLYVVHTNWDAVEGGVSDALAEVLELDVVDTLPASHGSDIIPLGRICMVRRKFNLSIFLQFIMQKLNTSCIRYVGKLDEEVKCVAVAGGLGVNEDMLMKAKEKNVDTYVTGDFLHRDALLAKALGIKLIGATHYATETVGMKRLFYILQLELPDVEIYYYDPGPPWSEYHK